MSLVDEVEKKVQEKVGSIPPRPSNIEVIIRLKAKIAALHKELATKKAEAAFWRSKVDHLEGDRQAGQHVPWIKRYLKFLIFACHPDRNPSRYKEATEVTKELTRLK